VIANGVIVEKSDQGCQALIVYGSCPLVFEFRCSFPLGSGSVPCAIHKRYVSHPSKNEFKYRGDLCGNCLWRHYELVCLAPPRPSLDRHVVSSDVEARVVCESGEKSGLASGEAVVCWSRKQKRGYNRVLSCLQYWHSHGYQLLWVMLSTGVDGSKSRLSDDHYRLRRMVERLGFAGIEHFQVRTSEGNGVLHTIWAWKCPDGVRSKSFYVSQRWLSRAWLSIHDAPIVWISRIRGNKRDMFRVARYCIAQYLGEQSGYEYMSYSWRRSFGFPLVGCWRKFKELFLSFEVLIREWSRFLAGELVWCDYGGFTMGSIRLAYSSCGREFWSMLHWR